MHELASADPNPKPPLRNAGNTRNIGSVGKTNQNVECAVMMASLSAVSRQSHMKVRSETRGSERITAPRAGLLFATSEAIAMIAPDRSALVTA